VHIFIGLLQDDYEALPDPIPGCLFTSYLYERAEYPDDVAEIATRTLRQWRETVARKIRDASAITSIPKHATPEGLAATLLALIEGGFVIAKAEKNVKALTSLLEHFRLQLEQHFNK
jgi:TetR/AcrR family transcriptional repressor of nem operon